MHTETPAVKDLVVEDVETGWVGAIIRTEKTPGGHVVVLEDRHGATRTFPMGPGFWIDGQPVTLVPAPAAANVSRPATRTASGSRAVSGHKARVALPSRLWVEGSHDAELVEKVWGDDLRVEGVVVEMLAGIDHLEEILTEFRPSRDQRAGVLVDHLVPGSKESRIAQRISQIFPADAVVVVGHPYVDVWQAVRASRLGWSQWPVIERDEEWKAGVCARLGWPAETPADIGKAWKRILATVRDYRDLEPAFLGRVEELIDFVTAPR